MSERTSQSAALSASVVFADWLPELEATELILVGFSGGLDSTVLLRLLVEVVPAERIMALHINHGLSANAAGWQHHAAQVCLDLGIQFEAQSVSVTESGDGIESAARDARYAVFEKQLIKGGRLLLGHHADDQVETVLYRLLRGSGPRGLSGIPVTRAVGRGRLIRPLLEYPKAALEDYAHAQKLSWIEDESNQDNKFDRNYLRNRVVPALVERWPDYIQGVTHSAELSRQADQLADAVARADLDALEPRIERAGWSLALSGFDQLEPLRQKNLLRYWPQMYGLPLLNPTLIDETLNSLLPARGDSEPRIARRDLQLCRYRQRLYLLQRRSPLSGRAQVDQDLCLFWNGDEPLLLPDGNLLTAEPVLGAGLRVEDPESLTVRFRRGGERCQPAGRGHSNSLKKLLQEHALEPWWRERIPLFYIDEQLVAVGDLWVCEEWQAEADNKGLKIIWRTNSL